MKLFFHRLVVIISCIALCACTTVKTQPINSSSGSSRIEDYKPGSELTLVLNSGERIHIIYVSMDETSITGTKGSSSSLLTTIPLTQVDRIESTDGMQLGKTGRAILLAAGIVLGLYVLGSELTGDSPSEEATDP